MTETLIHRARVLLGIGMTQVETARALMDTDVSPELAYLAVKAAHRLDFG